MIEFNQVGFQYGTGRWIFRDYSFDLGTGEIMAVIGPNGRGKTTLLKVIAGQLKPSRGQVYTSCEFGMVHQHSHSPFSYTVMDMVLMGRARHIGLFSAPDKTDLSIAADALECFGLLRFKDHPFECLSGGERQLVLIARALASGCTCLLLDEPASALDFRNQNIVLKTLKDLSATKKISIVFTTHFPQHAIHIANKVLMMHDKSHYQFGEATELMTDQALQELYEIDIRNIVVKEAKRTVYTVVPIFS